MDSPLAPAIERTARRYAAATEGQGAGTFHYVRTKLRSDPSAHAIATRAPLGDVIDLGCGRGQLAVLLLESEAASRVRGVDWDAAKIAVAKRASVGLAASFDSGDLREVTLETADTVLLVDVLHYFEPHQQDALLARAAELVRPGGRLLVRDGSKGHGVRTTLTLFAEWLGTRFQVNRGEQLVFRDLEVELVPLLEARGFACSVEPCWGSTPFSNVLLEGRRQ